MLTIGCQEESSNTACGVLFPYDKQFEQQASLEYKDMKQKNIYPHTRKLLDDYELTRDTIRNCR